MAKPIDLDKIIENAEAAAKINPEAAKNSSKAPMGVAKSLAETFISLATADDSNYEQRVKGLKETSKEDPK